MAKLVYDKDVTALLVVDPYNDFISEGGKLWDRLKGVAEANQCVAHMVQVLNAARKARLLCAASSISPWRLRDLEVHCACPEGSLVAQDFRKRHVGRRDPGRIRTATGRHRGPRALVFQRFCQHRSGFAAQKTRHPPAHRHGTHSAHLCGGNCSLWG